MKVRYEFDEFSGSHFIEVLPSKEFKENPRYAEYETKFIIDFIESFPNEEIVFLTENDLIEVSNPYFVKEGKFYARKKNAYWNSFDWSKFTNRDFI